MALLLLFLPACGKRLHVDDAREEGATRLSGAEIENLVKGSTVHLVSWNEADEADVHLAENGSVSAENSLGEKTGGRWGINKEENLCLRFRDWGEGDLDCYQVYRMGGGYKLFQPEGGLQYSLSASGVRDSEAVEIWRDPTVMASDEPESGGEEKGWWSFSLFGGDDEKEMAEKAEPLSRQMQHLLEEGVCLQCDLSGSDLSDADLEGDNLEEADLSGANLARANLQGANLRNANLSGANLEGADLADADLRGADLRGARLVDAGMKDAVLKDANLDQANLHWTDARKADFSGASLKGAYLVKTDFSKADLSGADLTDAVIQRATFKETTGYTPEDGQEADEEAEKKGKKSFFGIF